MEAKCGDIPGHRVRVGDSPSLAERRSRIDDIRFFLQDGFSYVHLKEMFHQWEQHPNLERRQRPRTRNGCLTCRRRKVRCDEARPQCGHCGRLQLDCAWQSDNDHRLGIRTKKARQRQLQQQQENEQIAPLADVAKPTTSPVLANITPGQDIVAGDDSAFNQIFNYARFMWDDYSPTLSPGWETLDLNSSQELMPSSETSLSVPVSISMPYTNSSLIDPLSDLNGIPPNAPTHLAIGWSESQLAEYFARSAAPPILATVETSSRWVWMRKELTLMTSTSRMVKFGVIAFVALELESAGALERSTYTQYYQIAKERLEECLREISNDHQAISSHLRHILAVLFLLSYIDLLTKNVSNAHANLREGFNALQMVNIGSLSVTEKRLLSWLRLLDARAVSAGGEGLFLTEDESPVNTDLRSPESSMTDVESGLDDAEAALEDFVMHPAYLFFQKVQLFMGRISKIDRWHRRRGTVEDETEVMLIAAKISRDIKSLWQQRPPLMDHAVAGRLSTLLPSSISETITRTMRVYHANYYASFVHLHRVAYKDLPRTTDVTDALQEIRQVTRLIQESPWTSTPPDISVIDTPPASSPPIPPLPVNMLWPLLMLGVETDQLEERDWVISCIKAMENVASNAGITSDVLQEVIRRQDEGKRRVDIRKVMHDIFDRAFAIV